MAGLLRRLLLPLLVVLTALGAAWGWAEKDKIWLRDVQTLTLYPGAYTTHRRTSPIPQVQCIGGKAGCAHKPDVVQCYNRGWDGYDVQWECKANLDTSYRFGKIEVLCEGYDYPDDPYILKGSCGVQYTLELTKEGEENRSSSGGVMLLIICVVMAYVIYKLCLSNTHSQHGFANGDGYSSTYGQHHRRPQPPGFNTGTYGQNSQSPPPPGFKSNFAGTSGSSGYDSTSGPGFWTGLGTGGLLGYLAGSQRSPSYYSQSPYGYNNTWTRPSAPPPSYGSSGASTSSGTRPTSGYGGTKRR